MFYLHLAVVFAAGAFFFFLPSPPAAADTTEFQGESMSAPRGKAVVVRDGRASARRALALERPAAASKGVRTPGIEGVSVRARAEQCKGSPQMLVYLDGRRVLSQRVRSDSWKTYPARVSAAGGTHRLQVVFRGDARAAGCDRDLKVDLVRFDPAPARGEAQPPAAPAAPAAPPAPDAQAGLPSAPAEAPKPACDRSLQRLVDGAAPGAVVEVPGGCVYRESVKIGKPLTLKAAAGAEIRGSDVWTGWTKSGSYWIRGTLPPFPTGGYCKPNTERCKWPEQVFVDGWPLQQVAAEPRSGQFAVDGGRRVILADDPTGRTVEVTTRRLWVSGGADRVTVEGFAMKHAANAAQSGALSNAGQDYWTVRNNDLSYAHGYNLQLGSGTGLVASGNRLHHGGQLGLGGSNADLEVRGNRVYSNNTEGFDPGWEAGGIKNARMSRIVVDDNDVYGNDRTGIWCDISCTNATISNNRVYDNARIGILYEISDDARIFNNKVWENGWVSPGGGLGDPGIFVASSRNVDVYDNTLAWNNEGIVVVNEDRTQGDGTQYDRVTGVQVHDNDILAKDYSTTGVTNAALAWVKAYPGGNILDPAANNRGYGNRYFFVQPEGSAYRFKWGYDTYKRLADFNATPGAEGGRYLSGAEKDRIVAATGVPAAPRR